MPWVFIGKGQTIGGGTAANGGGAIQFRHSQFALSGTNNFTFFTGSGEPHTLFVSGNVVVSGTLEANTYRVNTIDTTEGSTIFGNSAGDNHQLTGTVYASADVHVGDDLSLRSDGAILKFGADNDVTFTHAGDGMNIAMAGGCEFDSTGGSLLFGNAMASGQTLKLGNEHAVQVTIAPHDTAGSERYLVHNNAGTAANAIGLTASAGGIALSSSLDMTFDANGGQFFYNDGGATHFLMDCDNTAFTIYDDQDTGDLFKIQVAQHGATTISTVDDDAAAANLTFTIDGAIKLDGAGVEIENDSATGAAALLIDNDDTDQIALDIDAANIDADVIDISADAVTTAKVIDITADALTTGTAIYVDDNSANTGTRNTVEIIQNHASAHSASALKIQSDGGPAALSIDKNYSHTNAGTIYGAVIDLDKTGASTSDNTIMGLAVDVDNTTATNGTNNMFGVYSTPTLQHAADAGLAFVKGGYFEAVGATNGTCYAYGIDARASGADANIGVNIVVTDGGSNDFMIGSSADQNDYFSIATTTNGATTIYTVDAAAAAAHLTFDIDGAYAVDAAGDVTLDAGGGDILLTGSVYGNGKIQATSILNVSGTNDTDAKLELRYKSDALGTKRARINFNSGSVNTATPDWSQTVHPANYAKLVATSLGNVALYPNLQYLDNAHLVSYGLRDRYGNKINGLSGYSYITVNASGNVGIGRDVYVNADTQKLLVDASGQNVHQAGLYLKGPKAGSQNADLNALFVSGTLNTTGGNNSFLINATCNEKQASGPLFTVSSSGQTTISTDMASGYPLQVTNEGNNANRYGIQVQAGADDASGQTYYLNCNDGDGGNVGYIENNGGTFRLVDPSDKRLKKNIKNTKLKGLATLKKIKVRDFELKKNNLPKTGFIAQELEKVYPPSVSKPAEGELDSNGNSRMMGVSYEALVPLLVKAVQELSAEVTELKKKQADG